MLATLCSHCLYFVYCKLFELKYLENNWSLHPSLIINIFNNWFKLIKLLFRKNLGFDVKFTWKYFFSFRFFLKWNFENIPYCRQFKLGCYEPNLGMRTTNGWKINNCENSTSQKPLLQPNIVTNTQNIRMDCIKQKLGEVQNPKYSESFWNRCSKDRI